MIEYTTASAVTDLTGILALQRQNLAAALLPNEIQSQGFVTVVHELSDLEHLNLIERHVIAKEGGKIVAYLLAMTEASKHTIPVLRPMFTIFENLEIDGKPFQHFRYMVVGQVCVAKAYRGQGVFDACYAFYKERFRIKYDFAVTEIDATNLRSLAAHRRIGFKELHRYTAPDAKNWVIVWWDWRN